MSVIGQKGDWEEREDLFDMVRTEVFHAAVEAMCGPHLMALNPGFLRDFWAFDAGIARLMKELPRWLIRRDWSARERCLQSVWKWHVFAKELD